jgi:hypothetical protein
VRSGARLKRGTDIVCDSVRTVRSETSGIRKDSRNSSKKGKILEEKQKRKRKLIGDAGDRTLYLSHAKRALYHLSYIPG